MKYRNIPLAQSVISACVVQFLKHNAGTKERENMHCRGLFSLLKMDLFEVVSPLEDWDLLQQQQDAGFWFYLHSYFF